MRIKTITCHDVYNVGASLQAYALSTYLKSLGHSVEIIDYKPDYLSRHFPLTGVDNPAYDKPVLREVYQILKFPGRLKAKYSRRKKEYDRFTEEYLPVTQQRYSSNDALKKNLPGADVYFAGSDQIWNTMFMNGKDAAFYLDFAPARSVKASYAASFSTETIADEWKESIGGWLSRLDYISVRESSGVKIIEGLGISGSVQVLDPVFLINVEVWEHMEEPMKKEEPYVLVYDFDRSLEVAEFSKHIAKEKGWKIYSIFPCGYCDHCFNQKGPQAFLSLVHHAEFVVSNSFHATAFSLIFNKQFVVFNRKEKINTRMQDLLSLCGLENRLISDSDSAIVKKLIDYDLVNRKLNEQIKVSKGYIDHVLEGVKKRC